jgi:hypothetical protein
VKGLSVRKIAALAAGTAILGASLAAADVMYGSTQIMNQNGQPVVKVVVGEKAAASDGVVAANIAAWIGNHAYGKQTYSATLSGTATCTTTSGSGAGSCPISNKKVTLEVTLPGVVSGSATFLTYVNDYVDKYLEDRQKSPLGVANNYSTTTEIKPCLVGSHTSGGLTSAAAVELNDPSTGCEHGRKISGGDFPALATATVRDTYSAKTYTEEQSLWVNGKTLYDESLKTMTANSPNIAYKVDFTHDLYGLPIKTCANYNSSSCTAYPTSTTDDTARHRVAIKFLGEDWIISAMAPPSLVGFDPSTYVATAGTGGTLSLAKESAYGIVHVGENLTSGAYAIKLADIALATGSGNVHNAAIEIYDANGVLVKEDQVAPEGTYTWTAPDGSKLKIHVYQTQPGYTLASKWAEMAVYSNEITLLHNQKMDNVDNPLWYPYLFWSVDPNNGNVPTLKTIIVRKDPNSAVTQRLQKGDVLGLITTPTKFEFKFDGLNLVDADYDTLTFQVSQYGLSVSYTGNCASSYNLDSNHYLMYVASSLSNGFTVNNVPTNNFYVDLTNVSSGLLPGNHLWTLVYYQQSGQTCYYAYNVTNSSTVAYYNLGDGVMQSINMVNINNYTTGVGNVTLNVKEKASTTSDVYDYFQVESDNSGGSWAFTGSSTQTKIRYIPTGLAELTSTSKMVEPMYTTERGSVFSALSSTSAVFKIAKKVGEARYYLSTVGSAAGGATEITLAEGESQTLAGGVVIKAKAITQTVGACTASGAGGACSVDMAPVKAVLSSGDDSIDAITAYTLMGDLVVLDSPKPSASVLISVGGPMVNEVTKEALGASSGLAKPGDVVVKEVGNVIVVAGYNAKDTMDAGSKFLGDLQVS